MLEECLEECLEKEAWVIFRHGSALQGGSIKK